MKRIKTLAFGTFKEGVRSKQFLSVAVFAVLMLLSALVMSEMSFAERKKIVEDVGLSFMTLFGLLVTLYVGMELIYKEIDRRTIYIILSKPVSRRSFIVGKYFGLLLLIFTHLLLMIVTLSLLFFFYVGSFEIHLFKAVYMIFLELSIIAAITVFFSSFTTPAVAAFSALSFYIIGYSTSIINAYLAKQAGIFKLLMGIVFGIFPKLGYLDIKMEVVHKLSIQGSRFLYGTLYSVAYILVVIVLSILVFDRREFK